MMERYTRHLFTADGATDPEGTCNCITGTIWMYRQVFRYKRRLLFVEIRPVRRDGDWVWGLERFEQ